MKNLIEYLLLFVIVLLFSPSNYFTMIYVILSFITCLVYFIYALKSKKENNNRQIDINLILVVIMVTIVNLIAKIDYSNLIFGYGCLLLFIINGIILIFKEKDLNKELFKKNYLFDMYTIIYLAALFEKFYNLIV